MNRDEAKKFLPIIKAFAEGKEIEVCINGKWVVTDLPTFAFVDHRIKSPKAEYRVIKSLTTNTVFLQVRNYLPEENTPSVEIEAVDYLVKEGDLVILTPWIEIPKS